MSAKGSLAAGGAGWTLPPDPLRAYENYDAELAEDLEVERIGPEHNAGSDSLLTQATFFKMRQLFFENELDDDKCLNCIHGLGKAYDQVA